MIESSVTCRIGFHDVSHGLALHLRLLDIINALDVHKLATFNFFFVSLQILFIIYMRTVLRLILLVINVLVAGAFVASTLAGIIPPSKCIWVSMLSYGYFVLLVANVLLSVVWLLFSRWEFLISIAVIVIRFSFVPLFFQVGGCVEPSEEALAEGPTIKIMDFNTHGFSGLDSDTLMTRDSGAALFVALLKKEMPDVVCMQEFCNPAHLKDSLEMLGYRYHYGAHGESAITNTVLYSKYRILRVGDMDRSTKFYADVVYEAETLRLCCVHLDSYQLMQEDYEGLEHLVKAKPDERSRTLLSKMKETMRVHEEEWVEHLEPMIAETRMPLVVMGDFNDTPASFIYQKMKEHLIDTYIEQGRGFATTYHGPYPSFRIDYILHSEHLQALSYKRIKTNISDHYPIVVTLRILES